jgi:hypothetical protein
MLKEVSLRGRDNAIRFFGVMPFELHFLLEFDVSPTQLRTSPPKQERPVAALDLTSSRTHPFLQEIVDRTLKMDGTRDKVRLEPPM